MKKQKKICPTCKNSFEVSSKHKKFCSKECRFKDKASKPTTYQRYCKLCGNSFSTTTKKTELCSSICRGKYITIIAKEKAVLRLAVGRKKCSKCGTVKDLSLFYKKITNSDGLDSWCKKCKLLENQKYVKNPEVASYKREFRKRYNLETKEKRKFNRMKHLYGVTFEEYNKMLKEQNGKCKICNDLLDFNRHAHIDHCHETNAIRGILCYNCNSGLGHFKDNIDILYKAIKYLVSPDKWEILCKDCHNKEHE